MSSIAPTQPENPDSLAQRADHFERAYYEAAAGRCWASGRTIVACKVTDLCDCFDFEWARP